MPIKRAAGCGFESPEGGWKGGGGWGGGREQEHPPPPSSPPRSAHQKGRGVGGILDGGAPATGGTEGRSVPGASPLTRPGGNHRKGPVLFFPGIAPPPAVEYPTASNVKVCRNSWPEHSGSGGGRGVAKQMVNSCQRTVRDQRGI